MENLENCFDLDVKTYCSNYLSYLCTIIGRIDVLQVESFIKAIRQKHRDGKKIIFAGNGGSAATASHFANDLSIGPRLIENPIRALSITDNVPIISAIGNDFGYDAIFSRQLNSVARSGDLCVFISASGNSPNLLQGVETAKSLGCETFGLTGFDGGALRRLCDGVIHIDTPKGEYGPVEDIHMIMDHLVGGYFIQLARRELIG